MIAKELVRIEGDSIKSFKTITEDEIKDINNDNEIISEFQKNHMLIEYVIRNYNQLIEYLINIIKSVAESESTDFEYPFQDFYLDINSLLVNYFTSIRTFLDHLDAYIKRSHGEKSEHYLYFKEITSKEFDNTFSYAFIYKLRNYVQHCGMPPISYNVNKQYLNNHTEIQTSLDVFFLRDSLLNEYDGWGAKVKQDLVNQPSSFGLIPIIEEHISSLTTIYISFFSKYEFQGIHNAKNRLLAIIEEKNGYCLNEYAVAEFQKTGKDLKIRLCHLKTPLLKKVYHFERLQKALANIHIDKSSLLDELQN
ncbi:hypothetical protein ACOQH3_002491 [Yersinia enterocolitica]|uniref:hypothetical protein n=1 Tax=Yersinia enterocolitica TaxID=630 RepID=UPI0005E07079|nr:hypothetical protein [Yersinia enterocolitica]EKN4055747.1 hypothetical protein [Yersinia enterocolitica]CQQ89156.1 Uncharacterised protein [Yersinia enterocolitica]